MTNRRSSVAKITMVGADIMSLLILYIRRGFQLDGWLVVYGV